MQPVSRNQQLVNYIAGTAARKFPGEKPFHAGKAAMDGILAAQLAGDGFVAATHLYELGEVKQKIFLTPGPSPEGRGGNVKQAHSATLLDVFIQDHDVEARTAAALGAS